MATLMAVILTMVCLDTTKPINCQVCTMFSVHLIAGDLIGYNSKVWVTLVIVSKASDAGQFSTR
jgi:hypothetical protein